MPEINIDLNFLTNKKTQRLIARLGKKSEVLLLRLWLYVAQNHPDDGVLDGLDDAAVESICDFWGKPGEMITALTDPNPKYAFLQKTDRGYKCINWEEYEGHLRVYKERGKRMAAARWDKYRAANAAGNAPSNTLINTEGNASSNLDSNTTSDAARNTAGNAKAKQSGAEQNEPERSTPEPTQANSPPGNGSENGSNIGFGIGNGTRQRGKRIPPPGSAADVEEFLRNGKIPIAPQHIAPFAKYFFERYAPAWEIEGGKIFNWQKLLEKKSLKFWLESHAETIFAGNVALAAQQAAPESGFGVGARSGGVKSIAELAQALIPHNIEMNAQAPVQPTETPPESRALSWAEERMAAARAKRKQTLEN